MTGGGFMVAQDTRVLIKRSQLLNELAQAQMQTEEISPPSLPLGQALASLLQCDDPKGLSIGQITAAVGEKGFGLLLVVLALPSALPVPAPGYSTPFGIVIALIALQMIQGRSAVWLPRKLANIRIRPSLAHSMLSRASRFLHSIERYIRPRQKWIRGRSGQAALATVILSMACLMILPIPLTNTAPAMVIFLIGVGLAEEDGLLAIVAFAIGCCAVLLYIGVIYLLVQQGPEAIESIKESIKSIFAGGTE
ncbi:MAG: exopolysaccharide biosynthesis protein [Puniceicoccaceae bacterium]|nr:MAG: exopolysaccharide biosynthesis protein [Puniceicoccaceae bacterium]